MVSIIYLILCGCLASAGAFLHVVHMTTPSSTIVTRLGPHPDISTVEWFNIAGSSSGVLELFIKMFPAAEKALRLSFNNLPTAKAALPILKDYVNRPELEKTLLRECNYSFAEKKGTFTVVVGPKGSGKSYLLSHILTDMPGVLYSQISQSETPLSICLNLFSASSGTSKDELGNIVVSTQVLYSIFEKIATRANPITLAIEIERGSSSEEVLYMVKSMAKELAHVVNVIVVLSEANAGLMFGDDSRHQFFWVDGMTHEEATAYAKKLFQKVADQDLELFFEKVGTCLLLSDTE